MFQTSGLWHSVLTGRLLRPLMVPSHPLPSDVRLIVEAVTHVLPREVKPEPTTPSQKAPAEKQTVHEQWFCFWQPRLVSCIRDVFGFPARPLIQFPRVHSEA